MGVAVRDAGDNDSASVVEASLRFLTVPAIPACNDFAGALEDLREPFDVAVGDAGVGGLAGTAEFSAVTYVIVLAIPDERHTMCKWTKRFPIIVTASE